MPVFDCGELEAINTYMNSGGFLTEFTETEKFENEISKFVGSKYCSVVSNGTVALFLMLKGIGIKRGDEVIVPDYTMIATCNAVELAGAVPIFSDVDNEYCLTDIENKITDKTKAVIYVSMNGRGSNIISIRKICDEHGIIFLEDAAQSLGSSLNGKYFGTFGEAGIYSFSVPKIINCGQGGAIVTDDIEIYNKIEKLKDFGRVKAGVDLHDCIGYNFKYTDLQSVIGLSQLKNITRKIQRKKEIYNTYSKYLNIRTDDFIKWFVDIQCEDKLKLQSFLKEFNIGSRVFYPPIHSQVAYNQLGSYPLTEYISKHGLWLPSSFDISNDDIKYISEKINETSLRVW